MKSIILIDLLQSAKSIVKLAKSLKIPYDFLLSNRRKGFAKVYLDTNDDFAVVAVTHKRTPNKIEITQFFIDDLKAIQPVQTVPPLVEQSNSPLSIDEILDKISNYGIESLSKKEKEDLDNFGMLPEGNDS